jgi:archaellum component FlaC
MTIDERLEALTTRHEALTMNMELLSHDREKDNERIGKLMDLAEKIGQNVEGLARIAEIHEKRISRLEGDGENGANY